MKAERSIECAPAVPIPALPARLQPARHEETSQSVNCQRLPLLTSCRRSTSGPIRQQTDQYLVTTEFAADADAPTLVGEFLLVVIVP